MFLLCLFLSVPVLRPLSVGLHVVCVLLILFTAVVVHRVVYGIAVLVVLAHVHVSVTVKCIVPVAATVVVIVVVVIVALVILAVATTT